MFESVLPGHWGKKRSSASVRRNQRRRDQRVQAQRGNSDLMHATLLLIGQAPGKDGGNDNPLTGRSGQRLAAMMGIKVVTFKGQVDRINVFTRYPGTSGKGDAFPLEEARSRTPALASSMHGRRVILLGNNVARAFGYDPRQCLLRWTIDTQIGCEVAMVPHPSGVNLWWNKPENRDSAKKFLRAAWLRSSRERREAFERARATYEEVA